MAERENINTNVDWDKYLDQSEQLIKMARKVTFLEVDKVQLVTENKKLITENNKLTRELYDIRNSYKQLKEGHKKWMSDFNAVRQMLSKAIDENALLHRIFSTADKWNEAKEKESVNDGRA